MKGHRGDVPGIKAPERSLSFLHLISDSVCQSRVVSCIDRTFRGDCLRSERKEMEAPGVAPPPQAKTCA